MRFVNFYKNLYPDPENEKSANLLTRREKMTRKVLVLLVVAFLAVPTAFSSILVEPFVGYGLGSGDIGGSSSDYSGSLFGGKLGYQSLGLNGGFRFDKASFETEERNGRTIDTSHTGYGIFVGYDLPILLRAAFTYYISSEQEVDLPGGVLTFKGSGQAIYFGLGFSALANIFFEYHQHDYDNDDNDSANWYFFGISLPLNF